MAESITDVENPAPTVTKARGRRPGIKNHLSMTTEHQASKSAATVARRTEIREAWVDETMSTIGVASRPRLALSLPLPLHAPT